MGRVRRTAHDRRSLHLRLCPHADRPLRRRARRACAPTISRRCPIRELVRRHPGLARAVDEVFLGSANQAGEDNRNLARMALLLAGLPESVPGVTVNRLCASGMDAVAAAARAIKAGEIGLALAGGAESMTRAPLVMGKAETAFQRSAEVFDTTIGWRFVNPRDEEALRRRFDAGDGRERRRRASDLARGPGRLRAALAAARRRRPQANGTFDDEIVAVEIKDRKGAVDPRRRRTSIRAPTRPSRRWRSCAASSAPTAASPRATRRASTTARRR